jgi:alpha-L-fucosidase 2
MWSMMDDFRTNARGLYDADGIFVPSRTSSSGKTYHYMEYYCHLFWFAGAAWTSQFFYDYWLYTGDEQVLKERTIPFMKESLEFYKDILIRDENGKYIIIPSYSPEIHPPGFHPAAINATMDVAAIKQLLRNMISLAEEGWIEKDQVAEWQKMILDLPEYAIDEHGDLREWIWPEYGSNNQHRHASHLYPLFYEVDPEFKESPELQKAAIQSIENRLKYRREKNGAEMAFGLVQKGLAAAHLGDTAHAYECIDWLCNTYWSPSLTSYHDPGEIFNVDICGGLPAVVTEMLVQSSVNEIVLLPALPGQWPEGSLKGARARGGFVIDMDWQDARPVSVTVKSLLGRKSKLAFGDKVEKVDLTKGESKTWEF